MGKIIKHANIIYIKDFSLIGGVETFTYEMIKKYKDLDIAVVYKEADTNQLIRVRKYCKAYKLEQNDSIECKIAIINYDTSVIDQITPKIYKDNAKEDEGIYQVVHGDYENPIYKWKPPTDDRIKSYIGVTKHVTESFKRITGLKNVIQHYNPLTIDNENKPIIIVSATRLSPIKGKDRMIKLAKALDNAHINYIWYIFTNDINEIDSPNVVYMKPRLDVYKWMDQATYICQLSDTEACSYTINEALYRNKPVIVTPLPYLEEIGVEDGLNAYIMDFDCSNINDIVKKITKVPKFQFKRLEDNYDKLLKPSKSSYKDYLKERVNCEAIQHFTLGRFDELENVVRKQKGGHGELNAGDTFTCTHDIAEYLLGDNKYHKAYIRIKK